MVVVQDGLAAFDRGLVGDEDGRFDVLPVYWMLPGRDGMTVCRELRRLGI